MGPFLPIPKCPKGDSHPLPQSVRREESARREDSLPSRPSALPRVDFPGHPV